MDDKCQSSLVKRGDRVLSRIKAAVGTVGALVSLLAVALLVLAHSTVLSATVGEVEVIDTAVDSSGNSYVTGRFSGVAIFGSGEANQTTVTSAGLGDIFIAKYDASGALLWAKREGGTEYDWGGAIAVDSSGNSYLTGHFFGDATFGSGEANQTTLTGEYPIFFGAATMFIAKYDSDGALAWVKPGRSAGGGRYSWGVRGNAIAVDSLGHSYVTGEFSATAIFGSGEPNRTELTAIYGFPDTTDIFIVKYSTSGVVQWARQAGGAFYDHGNAIAVDGSGNSYIWGTYSVSAIFGTGEANETTLRSGFVRTGFVAKYNTSGWLQWAKKTGATGGGPVDFDEDGKSDVAIYRNGAWSVQRSSDGLNDVKGLGGAGWLAVPADYDGDGKSDVAIYKDGEWYWVRSSDGVNAKLGWGGVDWEPVPGDYDGDGMADIAVYHAASGSWSIVRTSDGANEVAHLGGADWLAVPADYDGDGRADLAVYLGGTWAIQRSSDGGVTLTGHGGPGWVPVPGDYDGDGKADIAVYMNGAWSILRSSDNSITVIGHGGPDWVPVPGDYDGDGKTDVAVYHPIGAWSIKRSSDGAIQVVGHGGGPTDVPLN